MQDMPTRSRLARRAFLGMAALAGAGALVAACAPAPTPTATPAPAPKPAEAAKPAEAPKPAEAKPAAKQPVELRLIEWPYEPDIAVLNQILDLYKQKAPHVKVNLESWPGDYYDKFQTQMAGGTPPDVMNMQTWRWQNWAAKGQLVVLDDLRKRDNYNGAWPEAWKAVYQDQTFYQGKCYARPYHMGAMLFFYLKEPFDKAGVKYPTDEWTIDEMLDIAQKLTVPAEKKFGYLNNTSYERMANWMRAEKGELEWDSIVDPKKANWDQPGIIDAFQLQISDVSNKLKVSPLPGDLQGMGYGAMMGTGRVAMTMEGPWYFPMLVGPKATGAGVPFDVVLNPKTKSGKRLHMVFGHNHVILVPSKIRDEDWELVKFIGEEPAQTLIAKGGRQPITPEFNDKHWAPENKKTFGLQNTNAFIKAFETGIFHVAGATEDRFLIREGGIGPAIDKIRAGEPASKIMPELNKQLQKTLDDFWARNR